MNANREESGSVAYVVLLALVAALGGLLFGYDTAVISGAIGFLQKKFLLDDLWKGWAGSCALVGCMIGALVAGPLSDRLGRKKALLLSAVLFAVSAIGTAIPQNLTQFVVARILTGIGVGMASMLSPLYIAEVSPARLRGRLVSLNQLAIVSGIMIVYFVNAYISQHGAAQEAKTSRADLPVSAAAVATSAGPEPETDPASPPTSAPAVTEQAPDEWNVQYGWRWMFASGVFPAGVFLFLLFAVPESPRWLIKQGQVERALDVLTRVGGSQHARTELSEIQDAIAHEGGSIRQLLLPAMRAPLIIGIGLAILQQVTGINTVFYYGPEILKHAGLDTIDALWQNVLIGVVNVVSTIIAIVVVDLLGRKPLLLLGSAGMGVSLLLMTVALEMFRGPIVLVPVLAYVAFFGITLGPVVWVVIAEIFPTCIRGRAMAVATVCLWISCFLVSEFFPYVLATLRGYGFLIYAAMCVVSFFFVLGYVPETKGKSLEEIERGWRVRRNA